MPARRRNTPRQRQGFTVLHALQLCTGFDWFRAAYGERPPDWAQLKADWADVGAELVALHVQHHPGSRPWAWWQLDAPERRRRVDGQPHPHDDGSTPSMHAALWYGCPAHLMRESHFDALYESQSAYLMRHGLLTSGEHRRLTPEDLDPVLGGEYDPPTLAREALETWYAAQR